MRPRCLFDTVVLLSPTTGIGRYTRAIIARIARDHDCEVRYFQGVVTASPPEENSALGQLKNLLKGHPKIKKLARKLLRGVAANRAETFDLYWNPSFQLHADALARRIVVSVHDLCFLERPDDQPAGEADHLRTTLRTTLQRADAIVCFSNFVKAAIAQRYGYDATRIHVIPHGVDHDRFRPGLGRPAIADLPERYLLAVGSLEPRKNLLRLLEAYHALDSALRARYPLVLAGFEGWNNRAIMAQIERDPAHVRYVGYLDDTELARLYASATLFVYPSLCEGFGLPPLEAMACGVPVLVSNAASLPEVCADAAHYCDPERVDDIASQLDHLLRDEALRARYARKGLEHARCFDWETAARRHLELFLSLIDADEKALPAG